MNTEQTNTIVNIAVVVLVTGAYALIAHVLYLIVKDLISKIK